MMHSLPISDCEAGATYVVTTTSRRSTVLVTEYSVVVGELPCQG